MNELTIQMLQKVLNYAEGMEDFASAQAPLLAQEIVYAHAISGWSIILSLPLLAAGVLSANRLNKELKNRYPEDCTVILTTCGAVLGMIFGITTFCMSIGCLLEAYFTPRLVVIEKVTQMIGNLS
jgi:hypothetical protein